MTDLGGDVDIRVRVEEDIGDDSRVSFFRFHSSDTLESALRIISRSMTYADTDSWLRGDWFIVDEGRCPVRLITSSNASMTLQDLDMWPGGSLLFSFPSQPVKKGETINANLIVDERGGKRMAPSELLSSHLQRFENDPLTPSVVRIICDHNHIETSSNRDHKHSNQGEIQCARKWKHSNRKFGRSRHRSNRQTMARRKGYLQVWQSGGRNNKKDVDKTGP
jgi:hypothetical protein